MGKSHVRLLIGIYGLCCLAGCRRQPESESSPYPVIKSWTEGKWKNKYDGAPDLAGILVQQFSDNVADATEYEGKHPCMIIYVFRDGRANQNGFYSDGIVKEDFWWTVPKDHTIWQTMDKSYAVKPRG